jgi:integrase/recombinase XerC
MKKDIETKLIIERDRRLRELPDFVADFIFSIEQATSIRTQIAYIKDIDIFFHYLKELPEYLNKDIVNFSPYEFKALNERDIRDFLNYISDFKKKYQKKDGSIVEQEFSNSPSGKARKKASLSTFWEYLIDNEYVDKNIVRKVDIKVPRKTLVTNILEGDEINQFLDTIMNDYNIETKRELLFHQRVKFRDYVMVLLMGFTGIRVSELVQLDIDDININHETMLIIRKGGKQAEKYIPESILKPISEYINLSK